MDVRCAGCHWDVSEWAARCPQCGRSLDDAELLAPDPIESLPPPPPTNRGRIDGPIHPLGSVQGTARKRAGLVVVAVLVVAAVLIGVFDPGIRRSPRHASIGSSLGTRPPITASSPGSASPVTGSPGTGSHRVSRSGLPPLPAGLGSERLFFADPNKTGLYQADGTRLTDPGSLAGVGYPLEPLVSGDGLVVYIHGNDAYRTAGPRAVTSVDLGAASWIFPGRHGAVGIETGGQGAPTSVEYMAADGTFPAPGTSKLQLPPGITAVAQVPSGLVVAAGATLEGLLNGVTHLRLSLIKAHSTVNFGTATAVIGVHDATVALVNCPSQRSSSCSLTLLNTTTHHVLVIRPPPGYNGFAQGGGFSPDGSRLAAFAQSTPFEGVTSLRLVVLSVATARVSLIGPHLFTGPLAVADATWSADGHWLFFGSVSGTFDAERILRRGPTGRPQTLSLATSLAVTGA